MVSRVQTLRSSTTGARPPAGSREPGELYVNFVDKQIGLIDATKTPQDLIPIRYFSATANYAMRDLVMYDGRIYRATLAITAGAWNQAQWVPITSASIVSTGVALFEQTRDYKHDDVVVHDGHLYRANSAVTAGAWNAANWTLISDYTLPAATAGALGGVKATAPVTGRFVTGINASGDLTFAAPTIPIATVAAIGGVKATAPVSGQFVTGINAAGGLTFAAPPTPPTYTLPAATTTALGGIKTVATPPAGQFINGFAADGTATYAAVTGFALLDATQSWTKAQRGTPVAGSGAFDFAIANNFTIAGAGAAVTVADPTNAVAGQSGVIDIDDAASVVFGAAWKFEGGAPTGSGAGKKDVVAYYVRSASEIVAKLIKDV